MVKKPVKSESTVPADSLLPLVQEIRDLVQNARRAAAQNVNTLQVITNFEIGRRIVEYEQKGNRRAEYGKQIIRELADQLTNDFGRGFSKRNLEYMRQFYREYQDPLTQIPDSLCAIVSTHSCRGINCADSVCAIPATGYRAELVPLCLPHEHR
jgi:hypothetical protein